MSTTLDLPLTLGADTPGRPASSAPAPRPPAASPLQPLPPRAPRPGNSLAALRAWLIDDLLLPAFRALIAREPVWQFGDRRRLPVEHGGIFASRTRPHCRRFMAATTDPRIREQHVMKASRSGYTQAALVRVCHMAVHDPGNVQFSAGSKKNSEEVNKGRLFPMFRSLGIFTSDGFDDDDATASIIRLGNMSVRISGSYTAGAFRTNAIKFFVNDDCELVTAIPGIGTPSDGARSRIRGIEGAQLASISRPDEWASPHHRDVATGTLEFLAVPCPHCGTFQELTINGHSLVDQLRIEDDPDSRQGAPINPPLAHRTQRLGKLRFDHCKLLPGIDGNANPGGWDFNRIVAETYYECVSGCRIDQDAPLTAADLAQPEVAISMSPEVHALHADGVFLTHKQAMMLSGRHLAANPHPLPADGGGPRSKRSEHNSDLSSLDFDMTWGHFAKKFAERAHDPVRLRNFLNEHAGLPARHKAREDNVTDEHIAEARAAYERGTIPFVPDIMVLSADSQMGFRKFVGIAARLDSSLKAWRDIAVVDYGYAALRSDVISRLEKEYPLAHIASVHSPAQFSATRTFHFTNGLVDAGGVDGNTPDVYELSFESGGRLMPSFGRGGETAELRPSWWSEVKKGWRGIELPIAMYWDDYWKRHIQHGCLAKIREIKACADVKVFGPISQLPTPNSEAAGLAPLDPSARSLPPRLWLPGLPADARRQEFEAEIIAEQLDEKGKWKVAPGTPNDFQDALKTCFVTLDLRLPVIAADKAQAKADAEANSKKP